MPYNTDTEAMLDTDGIALVATLPRGIRLLEAPDPVTAPRELL
jgi:hypothetical protein